KSFIASSLVNRIAMIDSLVSLKLVVIRLFFVPAVVAVVNYQPLMRQQGLRIMLVLVISTIVVIAVTAWVVDKLYRFELKWARRKSHPVKGA
ncbi:CidA/LrgA family protein, partial [Vibrio cincinnatiensis]